MQIESQEGLIELPVEQLLYPAGTDTNMNGWTQKMRDTFQSMSGRAREASKVAYHRASESYSRVASVVRTQGAFPHFYSQCDRLGENAFIKTKLCNTCTICVIQL